MWPKRGENISEQPIIKIGISLSPTHFVELKQLIACLTYASEILYIKYSENQNRCSK
jgi:hypothetical protein